MKVAFMDAQAEGPYAGAPGQTHRSHVQVTGSTGATFPAEIYTSVNVTKNPELLEDFRAGNAQTVTCPHTDEDYELAAPIVYHDEVKRIFALVLPSSLRHREFEERARLLKSLAADPEPVPAYVRNFQTVFDPAEVEALAEGSGKKGVVRPQIPTPTGNDAASSKALEKDQAELEAARRRLRVEEEQLDEVRDRLDREREQMDQVESRLSEERASIEALRKELERERQSFEAEKLNEERKAIGADVPANEEATQVVTDDQLIVVSEEDVDTLRIEPITSGVPAKFGELASKPDQIRTVKIHDDAIVVAARLEREAIEAMFDGEPDVFTQLHVADGYPIVSITMASFDDNGELVGDVAWPLDVADAGHRLIADRLSEEFAFRAGFYDADGGLLRAVEVESPLRDNLEWVREEASKKLESSKPKSGFKAASDRMLKDDFERVGSMKHNFERDSFDAIQNPSEAMLAAGIVGFWSTPEKFEYLVGNRSFPLPHFRQIQERVVKAAVENGIFINEALREIALELDLAADEESLLDVLTANFAEVCISIRSNDLDAGQQWDNWDSLLGLGDDLGVPPDPDVVELAEVSLKRAQELAELEEVPTSREQTSVDAVVDHTLVVARRSEATGVTYFLPDEAIVDSFDDLAKMNRDDIELLLGDPNGRLEAAQVMLDRFGASATSTVLEAAESMNAPEIAALARFVETKAGELEAELVRCVENGGPSATLVAASALASIKSTSALPVLLEAYSDPARSGDPARLARVLATYADKLVAPVSRAIKKDGASNAMVALLIELDKVEEGTLNQLSRDRSKALRDAARKARESADSV